MRKFILLLLFILMHCGNGPAEDRGKRNCLNARLFALALYSNNYSTRSILLFSYSAEEFDCDESKRDSTINRYYRGYVKDKE
jgi:hypothetical protein